MRVLLLIVPPDRTIQLSKAAARAPQGATRLRRRTALWTPGVSFGTKGHPASRYGFGRLL